MPVLYFTLRLIHIACMATWFGATLFQAGDLRRSLTGGPDGVLGLRDRMNRTNRVAAIMGLLTITTGLGLIYTLGGFGSVPKSIHVGLGLATLMMLVGGGGIDGTWKRIEKQLDEGAAPESLAGLMRRLSIAMRIVHAMWLTTLVMMVFRASLF